MATLKPVVQQMRTDGYYQVYVRVTHNRKVGFIKTDKLVAKRDVSKTKEIRDNNVLKYCADLIYRFNQMLSLKDCSEWSVQEVMTYLRDEQSDICFSDYATKHINKMFNEGHERNSRTYRQAVHHLELFLGTNKIMFGNLTSAVLTRWIEALSATHRAKEQYPVCVRQIFRAAMLEYNDPEKGFVRIKSNPWPKVQIPTSDPTTKRAIAPEQVREFFNAPLPASKMIEPLTEFGRDVAKLVLCLAGINTIDLYNLQKRDYKNGIISYKRAKTKASRRDEAYFEIRVEPIIQPLIEKYLAADNDPYLFNFHNRFSTADSFNANVNTGIKKVCKGMGLPKEDWYCVYTFRHTWATVAQNDCGATIAEVGFGMNHSHGHTVTRGYIKLDFSPAWELNAKIIDFIFFTEKKSKQAIAQDIDAPKDKLFRLSKKKLVYAMAYYKGELLAEINDIGFGTVNAVIKALVAKLPDTIPTQAIVQFRIKNMDTGKEVVYEKQKGKGF